MTAEPPRILIAAASPSDAAMVSQMMRHPQARIRSSVQADQLSTDFTRHKPQVLVLAYKTLAAAQDRYAELCQGVPDIACVPHQTIVLCDMHEVPRAFELCRDKHFDDYVLFWPMVHDACRLAMSVRLALRALEGRRAIDTLQMVTLDGQELASMEGLLDAQIAHAQRICDRAQDANRIARAGVDDALHAFGSRAVATGLDHAIVVNDVARLHAEFNELGMQSLKPLFEEVDDAQSPMRQWVGNLKEELAPPLRAARAVAEQVVGLRPRLLVVDDDAFFRKLLRQMLAQICSEVHGAASGEQAEMLLRTVRPDLILMDVKLPDVDGIALTRKLKAHAQFAAIPVIMVTGQSEKQVMVDSLAAGAADFIVKPVDRELLLRKIARHAHMHSL